MRQITVTDDGPRGRPGQVRDKVSARAFASAEWPPAWAVRKLLECPLHARILDQGVRRPRSPGRGVGLGRGAGQGPDGRRGGPRVGSKPGRGPGSAPVADHDVGIGPCWSGIAGEATKVPANRLERIARGPGGEVRRSKGRPHFLVDEILVGDRPRTRCRTARVVESPTHAWWSSATRGPGFE